MFVYKKRFYSGQLSVTRQLLYFVYLHNAQMLSQRLINKYKQIQTQSENLQKVKIIKVQKNHHLRKMIKSYITNLQIRLHLINDCIGGVQNYDEQNITQIKNKTAQFISKLHKDTQRKFQKIRKAVEKYGDTLDSATTLKDKLNIVGEELEELKDIEVRLQNIEKLLPNLNTDQYLKIKEKSRNIDILMTASAVELGPNNQINITNYKEKPLTQLREQHREEMNQLMELNKRVIGNLNAKLQKLMQKRAK